MAITTASLPEVVVPAPFSVTLSRSGGSANVTWSIVTGSNIAWLTIASGTGVLSGTPAAPARGPVSVTIRVVDDADSMNTAERTFTFFVAAPSVSTLAIVGMPTAPVEPPRTGTVQYGPGWGAAVGPTGDIYFSIASPVNDPVEQQTYPGGIGFVPPDGGAYTSVFNQNNRGSNLKPQTIFLAGTDVYALNGIFDYFAGGRRGLYLVTDPTSASLLASPPGASGSLSQIMEGWYSNGSNFYATTPNGGTRDVFSRSLADASTCIAIDGGCSFTNATNRNFGTGLHGVAASASRLYVFNSLWDITTYSLDATGAQVSTSVTPVTFDTYAGPIGCRLSGGRVVAALNDPVAPTRLYYARFDEVLGSANYPANRICEVTLDGNGRPTGLPRVLAGPATNATGSVDGPAASATFHSIRAMAYDTVNSRLVVLQFASLPSPDYLDLNKMIRVVYPR